MPNFEYGMIYQPFMTVIICLLSIFVKYNANNQSHTGNLYANNSFILYVITLSNEERYTPATTVKSTMSIESGVYGYARVHPLASSANRKILCVYMLRA